MGRNNVTAPIYGPWFELPVEMAHVLRPRADTIATEMIQVIQRSVASYRGSLESPVGRDLVGAVRRAVYQFVELIEDPGRPQDQVTAYFRRLGRTEFFAGRDLDHLQEAYRIGAQVACRCYVESARQADLPLSAVLRLGEAVLVHINALANESTKGYAEAKAVSTDEIADHRRALAERLLQRDLDGGAALEVLADKARWPLPDQVACLVVENQTTPPLGHLPDVLFVPRGTELRAVLPVRGGLDREHRLRAAFPGRRLVVGPAVPLAEAWLSLHCARLTVHHIRRGRLPGDTALVRAETHLTDLVLLAGEPVSALVVERLVDPLEGLSLGKAKRLEETLRALLSSWSRSAPEVATALGIHPQTARNRLRQLRELFGDRLGDANFRFDAELALRLRDTSCGRGGAADA
ncbi:helix-turn-helix domain-containing protein [Streptomyces sp. NPDC088812]|uniref:helix-turn-helix domain-containing protein n=1 Tax=Streptomyces sp. NPDC088812 TaxID=3365905 RepID=UPI0037FDC645